MSIVRIHPEGRRNAEHIAIIVVVDLVPIQCHFRSSSSGATTIADDGHRPIHLLASNPTGVTATGPALPVRARRDGAAAREPSDEPPASRARQ